MTYTATVSATTPDTTPGNNVKSDVNTVVRNVDLATSITTVDTTVSAGQPIVYTVRVTNNGPATSVAGATETFVPDAGLQVSSSECGTLTVCNLPALASGESFEYRITLGMTVVPGGLTTFSSTATAAVAGADVDPVPGNNAATVSSTYCNSGKQADLAVVVSDSVAVGTLYQSYTYTVVVENRGPDNAPIVTLTSQLASGTVEITSVTPGSSGVACLPVASGSVVVTCDMGAMAAQSSKTVQIGYKVIDDSASSYTAAVRVVAGCDATDGDDTNNVAEARTRCLRRRRRRRT